jgi:hypothetical protein
LHNQTATKKQIPQPLFACVFFNVLKFISFKIKKRQNICIITAKVVKGGYKKTT